MESKDFEAEYTAIQAAAGQIVQEINELVGKIEGADGAKEAVKSEYARALDAGDEKAMKAALAKIRESNAGKESALALLQSADLTGRIQALQERQQDLRPMIISTREAAEAAMKAAEAAHEAANQLHGRWQNLQAIVNAARDQLTAAKDALGPNLQDGRIGTKGAAVHS